MRTVITPTRTSSAAFPAIAPASARRSSFSSARPGQLTNELPAFLRAAAARSFCYGSFDCFLFPADWCVQACGIDPAAGIRGRYDSTGQGLALVGVKSLPMAFHRLLRRAGLRRAGAVETGDIAVISISGLVCGAIVTAAGYVVIGESRGLSRVPFRGARCIGAWSLDA